MRFFVRLVINAIALWFTTYLVSGVHVTPFGDRSIVPTILTYLLVAFIFGIVNGIVGTVIRVVAFPLYILTLGLISLVVNGLLLLIVAWVSGLIGFGLTVDNLGWGILGALVLAILAWVIGLILRPLFGSVRARA
ncbi:phage holin family protein [Frondihabitans australicus]|uniref:Putative membrane protein n=1 Tax=Frondihabitans australicus TaxID=386892 RepID=A0A495ILJ5_9MICO|nr:phage holin family protein [Frondihabitans australicus]RKR76036.1 putative membrane protein [Frondihabitans australicus]